MPGTPPNTRRGLLKHSLLFGVEKQRPSVVIGPAESFIGTAMTAHEFGGIYRKVCIYAHPASYISSLLITADMDGHLEVKTTLVNPNPELKVSHIL